MVKAIAKRSVSMSSWLSLSQCGKNEETEWRDVRIVEQK